MYKHDTNGKETDNCNIKYLALEADNSKLTVEIESLKANIKSSLPKLSEIEKNLEEVQEVNTHLKQSNMEVNKDLDDKCLKLEADNQSLIIQVKVLKISLNKSNIKVGEGENK